MSTDTKTHQLTDEQVRRLYATQPPGQRCVARTLSHILEELVEREREWFDCVAKLAGYASHLDSWRKGRHLRVLWPSGVIEDSPIEDDS